MSICPQRTDVCTAHGKRACESVRRGQMHTLATPTSLCLIHALHCQYVPRGHGVDSCPSVSAVDILMYRAVYHEITVLVRHIDSAFTHRPYDSLCCRHGLLLGWILYIYTVLQWPITTTVVRLYRYIRWTLVTNHSNTMNSKGRAYLLVVCRLQVCKSGKP